MSGCLRNSRSKVPFGEFAKLVGDGTRKLQGDRTVPDRVPAETIADQVNGAVGHRARHASFAAGPALLIFKPERQLQLYIRVLLEVRHGDREQRDGLLIGML